MNIKAGLSGVQVQCNRCSHFVTVVRAPAPAVTLTAEGTYHCASCAIEMLTETYLSGGNSSGAKQTG